jgi:hypothetical protein
MRGDPASHIPRETRKSSVRHPPLSLRPSGAVRSPPVQ